jgi:two-component system, OmpR family, sensor kinase
MMNFHEGSVNVGGWGRRHRGSAWRFHVFPQGLMCSLRRALLLWLVPMFLVVGGLSAALSYWSYANMVREFMDDQMQQLAGSLSDNKGHLMPPLTNAERVHKWGMYVVQVWGLDGQLQQTTWADAHVALQPTKGFADVSDDETGWRVYTGAHDAQTGRVVQVVQSGKFRTKLAVERATAALAPVLILLPLALLVLWGLSGAVSRAIQDIGREAAKQKVDNITELSLERVPAELRPLVETFNSVLTRLRDAFAAKRRFVQDAAHELRTPLTALSLQLENLRRDLPPNACAQSFAQLEQGVKRAERLVDQLLKLSRHEGGAGTDAPVTVDLHAQVHESISTLIALADQRGIDLGVTDGAASGTMNLRCAAGDLRSVLDNLIENALRYTPEGGVVDVRVVNEQGKPAIEVVDTGPGIPPELIGRVFDRFFRVPGTSARGSGLGLAIAQAAAERCGLRVVLRNRSDRSGLIARVECA